MIIVRITLTEPKTALAGLILEGSFARVVASIAAFKAEITPSRSLGRWDMVSMVETSGRIVRREGCEEGHDS